MNNVYESLGNVKKLLDDDNVDTAVLIEENENYNEVNAVDEAKKEIEKKDIPVKLNKYQKRALNQALLKNKRQFKIQLSIEPGMSLKEITKSIEHQMKEFELQLYDLKVDSDTKKILK